MTDDPYAALNQHLHGDGETEMEHIARDIREGRFPKRSERRAAPPFPKEAPMTADLDLSPEAVERFAQLSEAAIGFAFLAAGEGLSISGVSPEDFAFDLADGEDWEASGKRVSFAIRAIAAENARLRSFLLDFSSNRFERFDPPPSDWSDPAAMPEPSTPYFPVEAWQYDAHAVLSKEPPHAC